MASAKRIAWESWNALCEEIESQQMIDEPEEDIYSDSQMEIPQEFLMIPPRTISSPMGVYPEDSVLRPSKRWDCWIGHTNFDLTYDISNIIEEVDGVEALKIMGRYSFFIGVAKLFDIKDVRKNIEQKLCLYTEQEVLCDEETKNTVNLVKKQLESKEYWSILVCPEGKVEYIVSDRMDKNYLDGLSNLIELKKNIGGIILRGKNG